jgi:hypothetical protein
MPYDQFGNFIPPYNNFNQPKPQNTYAFVNGLDGAKQYNIPVNQSMLLMDNTQAVCYLKQANALGQTSLKCFKLVEVNEADLTVPAQPKVEYATKDDIKALNERLERLEPKEK